MVAEAVKDDAGIWKIQKLLSDGKTHFVHFYARDSNRILIADPLRFQQFVSPSSPEEKCFAECLFPPTFRNEEDPCRSINESFVVVFRRMKKQEKETEKR